MNDTRKFIFEIMIFLVCYLVVLWMKYLIQVKAGKEPADILLILLLSFGVIALYSLMRAGVAVIRILAEQSQGNHEFWASIVVAFLMLSTTKPIDTCSDFIVFLAGMAVIATAFIKAKEVPK